ncbi:MAG: glycoside hydrolase family 15 protein [Phycisphaeraceae bacterium]
MRIEDYAMIGDLHTAALVGNNGSIDWLCLPRFDSGACFASLLGDERNGHWQLAPAGGIKNVSRRYREGTLILETEFETEDGTVLLTDFMPPRGEAPDIVRVVECTRGRVPMAMQLVIRFDYGANIPWVRREGGDLLAITGPNALRLRTPVHSHGKDFKTVSDFVVEQGDRVPFVLSWYESHKQPPKALDGVHEVAATEKWWRKWSDRCKFEGGASEAVMTSLLVLRGLIYEPTGGIVAAPTTSLPEQLGGVRNWDYRYCWVRDATLTLYALVMAGYVEEAGRWRDWLLRAVSGDPANMQIMYGLAGERRLTEFELDWLPGYEGSKPVRIGNKASEQFQLDVYGELADVLFAARKAGMEQHDYGWSVQAKVIEFLEASWKQPDDGIWEVRGPRRNFTHSKVMAWAVFDRAIRGMKHFGIEGPVDRFKRLRKEIHEQICREGFDPDRNTFTQYYGSKELDASCLLIPQVGFLPADDPRVHGTVGAIQRELMVDGFVMRYSMDGATAGVDGLPPGEAAFLPCSFWLADALTLMGRRDEAQEVFDRLLSVRNDVGLLSEEYDTQAKRLVGNFPQAFTHVGLVGTAHNLADHGPAHHRSGAAD